MLTGWALLSAACGVSQEAYVIRTNELDHCQAELTRTRGEAKGAQTSAEQAAAESSRLRDRVTQLQEESARLAGNLSATQSEIEGLRRAHAQAEQRSALFQSLSTKLRGLGDTSGVTVAVRKGSIAVELRDQPIFDAGKADLKATGTDLLRQIAAVLKEIPDRNFLVAGHTDNAPLHGSPFRSNWDLSTARAVTIVRFLQAEGVDPRRLAAAGYSEFDELGDNATAVGRDLNRRVELIVMPSADELPAIDTKAASVSGLPLAPSR